MTKRLVYKEFEIYGYEPYFNKFVRVAWWHHTESVWYWCHGYFPPHPYAKRVQRWAKKRGQKCLL